jgi:hypothetical protein
MQNFQINALLVEREKLLLPFSLSPSLPSPNFTHPFFFHAADTNRTYLRRKLGQKSRHFLMASESKEQGTKLTAPYTWNSGIVVARGMVVLN